MTAIEKIPPATPPIEEKQILEAVLTNLSVTYNITITHPYQDGYTVFINRSGVEIGGINFDGYNLLYCLTAVCKLLNSELL